MGKSQSQGLDLAPTAVDRSAISLARLVWAAPLALLLSGAALYGAYEFPVVPLPLLAALLGYAALLWREPRLWMFFVPALLPVLNLAPWSGRFFFDELDLCLLVTIAVCALRGRSGQSTRLAPAAGLTIALFVSVFLISLAIGLVPFEPLDGNSFANYYSKYNGLRVGKGLAWGIALLLLVRADLGRDAQALATYWVPGRLAGLAGVVAVAVWERLAFPGLTNFSEDYRVSSTFGAMHVGGGAIDGYLVLALPFTLVWLSETKSLIKLSIAASLFALGSYTVMVTFSRGLYVACLVMIVALGFGAMVRQKATGVFSTSRALLVVTIIFLLSGLCFSVFATGGYRSLAAVLGFMVLAFFLGRKAETSSGGIVGLLLAATLIVGSLILIKLFDKGAYIAYAVAFLVGFLGVMLAVTRPRMSKRRLAWAGFFATALVTPFVGYHWGGPPALWATLNSVLLVLALLYVNRSMKRPLWHPSVRDTAILAFLSLIFFVSIPIAGNSYFVSARFSDRSGAVNDRMRLWQDTLNMMDNTPITRLFGMGVGRFPALFFWRGPRTRPGTFTIMDELGNNFLRLGGTRDDLDGVTLFYAQRISPEPYGTLRFSFDVRSTFPKAGVSGGVCESLLLYSENCETKVLRLVKTDGSWQRLEMTFNTGNRGTLHHFGKRPVQVWLVTPTGGPFIDIDNVHLLDDSGNDLLKNGDFTKGGDHWLFSVSNFWPWHIESIWVHTLFEQGWLGLVLLAILMLYAICRLLMLVSQGHVIALAMFVSFAGFLTVGTVNSLFEFPRVALLFYVLLFIALTRWSEDTKRVRRDRSSEEVNNIAAG